MCKFECIKSDAEGKYKVGDIVEFEPKNNMGVGVETLLVSFTSDDDREFNKCATFSRIIPSEKNV